MSGASVDAFIEGLSAEAREAMGVLLRRAYDTGFREALASAGQAEVAAPVAAVAPGSAPAPAPASIAAPVKWAGGAGEGGEDPFGDDAGEDEDEDEDDDEAAAGEAPAQRPILPHATIGTLRRRILSTFDLGRFAIDVVICREGDPEKRQLQNRARLKLYRREEQ